MRSATLKFTHGPEQSSAFAPHPEVFDGSIDDMGPKVSRVCFARALVVVNGEHGGEASVGKTQAEASRAAEQIGNCRHVIFLIYSRGSFHWSAHRRYRRATLPTEYCTWVTDAWHVWD